MTFDLATVDTAIDAPRTADLGPTRPTAAKPVAAPSARDDLGYAGLALAYIALHGDDVGLLSLSEAA